MGIAALTLGSVALFTWMLPPLGFIISIVGIIFGIVAIVQKRQRRRAIAGLIMSGVAIVLSSAVLIGFIAAGLVLEEYFGQFGGY